MLTPEQEKELQKLIQTAVQLLSLSQQHSQQALLDGLIDFSKKHQWFDMVMLQEMLREMQAPIFLLALSRPFWYVNTIPQRPYDEAVMGYAIHFHYGGESGFLTFLEMTNSSLEENIRRLADSGLSRILPGTETARMAKGMTGQN